MTAFGLRDILGKVFYSLQDTKTPMVNGIISVGVNIVLDLVLAWVCTSIFYLLHKFSS
ncbi:lipid II flippase MurJ [Clostridioides difficile]